MPRSLSHRPGAAKDSPPSPPSLPVRRVRGPSLHKTGQTRQQIAAAALAEFLQVGLARATMDQIAARADVAKGTLYRYFPSKEALLQGVIEAAISHSVTAQKDVQRRPGETVQALLQRTLLPSMQTLERTGRADLARLILSEARCHPDLATLYRELAFEPWQQFVRRWLEQAIAEGELQGVTAEQGAQLMASPFWLAMVHNGLLGASPLQPLDVAQLMGVQLQALFAPRQARPGTEGMGAAAQ